MKKFFKEFKEFISRGNVVDLAVAVIIGGAFSAIVTAFTNKIIMPIVNLVLSLGGDDGLSSAYTFLKKVYTDGELDLTKSIYIDWGAFITAVVDFIIIAFVVFCIVKVINTSKMQAEKLASKNSSKKEIRKIKHEAKKIAKNDGRKTDEVYAELIAKQTAEKEAIERANKEKAEAERLANPSQEDLLKEIRDLLKAKK